MAKLEMAEPPNEERSFKYWEGRVYNLEERVHVLENRYRNEDNKHRELIGEISKVRDKVEVVDLRQDLLAGNLVDVRELVKEILRRLDRHDKRFEQVDKRFEQADKRFEGIEKTQAAHGEMLQKILERLPSPN
jgi:chromosome segregation ATPase